MQMYAEKKPDKVDKREVELGNYTHCRLSGEPLREPIVGDAVGYIYNREAVLHTLLNKNIPGRLSHIKGMKDVFSLSFEKNPAAAATDLVRYQCPVTGLEFNGRFRFVYLKPCGHVLSERALKELPSSNCIQCQAPYTEADIIIINPTEDEANVLSF